MNTIIYSVFSSKGVRTTIFNPSPLVIALMRGISLEEPEIDEHTWFFHHHEIGDIDRMKQLFISIEKTGKTLRELEIV